MAASEVFHYFDAVCLIYFTAVQFIYLYVVLYIYYGVESSHLCAIPLRNKRASRVAVLHQIGACDEADSNLAGVKTSVWSKTQSDEWLTVRSGSTSATEKVNFTIPRAISCEFSVS